MQDHHLLISRRVYWNKLFNYSMEKTPIQQISINKSTLLVNNSVPPTAFQYYSFCLTVQYVWIKHCAHPGWMSARTYIRNRKYFAFWWPENASAIDGFVPIFTNNCSSREQSTIVRYSNRTTIVRHDGDRVGAKDNIENLIFYIYLSGEKTQKSWAATECSWFGRSEYRSHICSVM